MFYATANNQGSADEAMNAFNAIALAAGVAGKDIASLVPMFDSLATGTVLAGSEMGSFMKIVGLTNEELKMANESGTLFATIENRLAEFGSVAGMSANTYDMELNKLKATISSLSTEASKPIFDTLKNSLAGLNQFLSENKEALNSCVKALSEVAQYVGVAGGAFGAYRAAVALGMSATVSFNASAITLTGSLATMSAGLSAAGAAFRALLPVAIIATLYEAVGAMRAVNDETGELYNNLNTLEKAIANFLNAFASGVTDLYIGFSKMGYELDLLLAKLPGLGHLEQSAKEQLKMLEFQSQANDKAFINKDAQINNITKAKNSENSENSKNSKGTLVSKNTINGAKQVEADLKEQDRLYLNYYESIGQKSQAWAIKEKELRASIAKAGITSETEAQKIIDAQKAQYMNKGVKSGAKSGIKANIAPAKTAEQLQREYEQELRNEIKKYDLIKDYENKKLKERELKTIEYERLGLSQTQIAQVFADEELEIEKENLKKQNDERIKHLEKMSKYYELLGEKAKAATYQNEATALELENEGYTKEEISQMQFGDERKKDNYNSLYQGMGWGGGIADEMMQRQQVIDEFLTAEVARIEAHYGQLSELDANYYAKKKALDDAQFSATLANSSNMFSGLSSLSKQFYQMSDGQNKTAFKAYQAFEVAKAIVSTYTSATKALETGGPIMGPVMAAVAVAQGMMYVAQIKAQKYHTGGVVGEAGWGSGYVSASGLQAGEVPAILQTGEGVLSRQGMSNLEALNLGQANAQPQNTEVVILNQVSGGVMEEYLQSRTGRKVIKNIINGE